MYVCQILLLNEYVMWCNEKVTGQVNPGIDDNGE